MARRNVFIVFAVLLMQFVSCNIFAQQALVEWVQAPLGQVPPIASYSLNYYPKEDVKKQDTTFESFYNNVVGVLPLINDSNKDLAILGLFTYRNITSKAFLPASGVEIPEKLYDLNIGPLYRYKFSNDWTMGVSLLFGSSSDKLFHSLKEDTIRFDAYLEVPAKENNNWLFYVDYYNNRDYWNGYPVPGAGYWYKPSDKFQAVIGLPIFYVEYLPFDKTKFEFTYIATTYILTNLSYDITSSLKVYGEFEWNDELYARADREKDKDRLFYYEKILGAGIHWQVAKYFGVDLSGGYAFDRNMFEAKKSADGDDNKFDIENGAFVGIRAGLPF